MGFLEYLLPLLRPEKLDMHLQHAFNACAMAHLNNRVNSGRERIGEKALMEYTRALRTTNNALRDPRLQKSDATLAAVLLLGMFEVRPYQHAHLNQEELSIRASDHPRIHGKAKIDAPFTLRT